MGLFALVGFIILVYTVTINLYPVEGTARLNTVFIAAISGSLALGGTLISQLWGKNGGNASSSPRVYNRVPKASEPNVSLSPDIIASFNKIMNEASINTNNITLKDDKTKSLVDLKVRLEGGNTIINPLTPLRPSTRYIVTISKDVRDIEGYSLGADDTWSFTTGEA